MARQIAIGALAVGTGALARVALEPVLSPDALLVFTFSVIVAAWAGGLVGGMVATIGSMAVGDYYFVPPLHSLEVPTIREAVRLTFFLVEGTTISVLFHLVRRSEVAERRARDQLRQFMSMVSHELRNPLNALATSAQLLANRGGDSRAAAVLLRQVEQLTRMVSDMSDLSRLERATLDIRPAIMRLNVVLESAIDVARPEFRQRDQVFEFMPAAGDPSISADAMRLQQVFANLLINASRYTPGGGHIRLHASHLDHRVTVTVEDDGRGFDPAAAPRLFEPFVREASDQPGTGLGLAISKALVERHGGSIRAESAGTGLGARFTVVLPVPADRP